MNRDIGDLEEIIQGDHDVESLTNEIEAYIDIERDILINAAIDYFIEKNDLDIGDEKRADIVMSIFDKIEPDEFK